MNAPRVLGACAVFALAATPALARAEAAPSRAFALIVGVNAPVDAEEPPLRYADDDAARYFDLFVALGARAHLVSRLDDDTRRLHPAAAAAALAPVRASFDAAATAMAAEVAEARAQGYRGEIYLFYAGHGDVRNGQGYVTLEDARLRGHDLAQAIRRMTRAPDDHVHVVVDACDSYFLAFPRGPGGERRTITDDASQLESLADDPRVGLLLSTSTMRESHEWEGFQAGVFSHEVRSALFGAADVDHDGEIGYAELGAYVQQANAAIANERFRPRVFARAPAGTRTFLRLGPALGRRIEIGPESAGRYFVEDAQGVRLADLHSAPGDFVRLMRMPGRLYVRRVTDDREFVVPPLAEQPADVLSLESLAPAPPKVASRGAAHEAFSRLFALPFDRNTALAFPLHAWTPPAVVRDARPSAVPWRPIGWTSVALGALAVGVGTGFAIAAQSLRASSPASQADASRANDTLSAYGTVSTATWIGGGIALLGGAAIVLFGPSSARAPERAARAEVK